MHGKAALGQFSADTWDNILNFCGYTNISLCHFNNQKLWCLDIDHKDYYNPLCYGYVIFDPICILLPCFFLNQNCGGKKLILIGLFVVVYCCVVFVSVMLYIG